MPDPTPTPTPAPPPDPKPKRAAPGDVPQQTLADTKLAEDVAAAAHDADHKDKLAEEQLPATAATDLETLAGAARGLAGETVTAKKAKLTATQAEQKAHKPLMDALRDIQQRAKGKFPTGDPKRAAYCINKPNFGDDRKVFEQDAENIINLGAADALRALTSEKIAAARAALEIWKKADQAQHKAEEDQGKLLGQLDAKVADMNAKRREIQLTADTAWPHTDSANAPYRRAFKLPVNQPIAK